MPRKSSGTVPAQTVRELGLPGRAVSALTRAGITTVDDLSAMTRAELAAVPGLGAGMVAAVRAVVPEPVASLRPATRPARQVEDQESPAAPSIPPFASLRDPRRRTPIDLIVPRQLELPEQSEVPDQSEVSAPGPQAGRPSAPRPPEWADLWHLGRHLARWWAHQPIRAVRRLLG